MEQAIILYDADCGFCRWATDKLLAWDRRRRLRPVALQDPEAEKLLPGMPEEQKMGSWHLVSDGRIYFGRGGRSAAHGPPPGRSSDRPPGLPAPGNS
jgi:predicted DCC family thiol-disulfide oxidoreductase YuxK